MPRAKGGPKTRQRRKARIKMAKGYWGGRHRLFRTATEAVDKGLLYAYRDRRNRKREFRRLWIVRINAGAREHGLSYSRFMNGLRLAGVELDRSVLADMAVNDPKSFGEIATLAKENLDTAAA